MHQVRLLLTLLLSVSILSGYSSTSDKLGARVEATQLASPKHPVSTTQEPQPFKVASVEFNPQFLQFDKNLPAIAKVVSKAAAQGAKLIVLPELSTSGYIYANRAQINPFLDTIPGKTTAMLEPIAKKYHVYIALGIAEKDPITHLAYNSAALVGPHGYIGKYRKNQLNAMDQRWATRGNLGYPVFDTELGKIALIICYDDIYVQSFEVPAIRGANLIAYITASDREPLTEAGAAAHNHSTIATVASLSGWYGLYIVASNRTDSEINPLSGVYTHYDGGAGIWDPSGKNLAQAPVSTVKSPQPPITIMAMVDPKHYHNSQKTVLNTLRRPALYQVLSLYRAPYDPNASTTSHHVDALLLQYTPAQGDKQANLQTITKLLQQASAKPFNLIVLPENSLVGSMSKAQMLKQAERISQSGTIKAFSKLAQAYHTHIIFSLLEQDGDHYYETAILMDSTGKVIGKYRKTHLSAAERQWLTPGDAIPVFNSDLGRVGIILGDEVRIPDLATYMAVERADIVAIPSSWTGNYGGPVAVDSKLLIKPYPNNTMFMWYNFGKYAQAYTLVANYTGGTQKYQGSSGLYSLAPIQGYYPPVLAPSKQVLAFPVSFDTIGSSHWWINQTSYINGRRPALVTPLLLDPNSICFRAWQKESTGNHFCWN